jgi:lipopolysaccharide/colanic/teichoic acid biosynthesis glycosyltransferase
VEIVGVNELERKVRCLVDKNGKRHFRNYFGLISVLKGDLSLVGTSITSKDDARESQESKIPGLWRKFLAKPGLFGPAYGKNEIEERFKADLYYIEKTSLFYDLGLIIWQIIKPGALGR